MITPFPKVTCTNTSSKTVNKKKRFNLWKVNWHKAGRVVPTFATAFGDAVMINTMYTISRQDTASTRKKGKRNSTVSKASNVKQLQPPLEWKKNKKKNPQSLSLAYKRWSFSTHAMLQSSVISRGGELRRIDTSHWFIFSFSGNEIKYITNIQLFFLFVHIEFDTVHLYTLFYKSVSRTSCSAVNKHTVKDMVSNGNSQSFTKVANWLCPLLACKIHLVGTGPQG